MAQGDVVEWGAGVRAVLVHGSLATGPVCWEGQRPLGDEGYRLVVPTRRAYTPGSTEGEDFVVDGADAAVLLGQGAHLVGHSSGALAAMVAAAARPEAVRSLVLVEPPLVSIAADDPDVARLQEELEQVLASDRDDRGFLTDFLGAVGTPLDDITGELLDELADLVPAFRRGRQAWHGGTPADSLVGAPFPIMVVSGNHHPAFSAICAALARHLGAEHRVVEGAGHEVQMVAEEFNDLLRAWWERADAR